MKYIAKYQWTYDTQDEDVGVTSGITEKEFDLPLNLEDAIEEIHRQLKDQNPASLRRSYTLLEVTIGIDLSGATAPSFICRHFGATLVREDGGENYYCPEGCLD